MFKRIIFALFTIVFGAFAGAFAWAFFFVMGYGIQLLWEVIPASLSQVGVPIFFYPVVLCVLGGLCIGLFTKKFGQYPESMNEVMAKVKQNGRYEYKHIGASFFGALFPLLFGGSIGPEAGLTGVIAGLCTWVGDRLKFLGAEMRELSEAGTAAVISAIFSAPLFGLAVPLVGAVDDSDGPRLASEIKLGTPKALKTVVYILAVAGALGAMMGLSSLFGSEGGLPHFSEIAIGPAELLWAIPIALVGAIAGWLYHPFGALAAKVAKMLGDRPVLKPVIAGAVLGLLGCFLPFVMFAGESQTTELMGIWTTLGAGVLLLTGVVKVFTTQLCLNLGWKGGHFFPVIFSGICIGYAMAALTGIDPVFALCTATAALLGAIMRQPVMTVLLLFLVFPVKAVVILLAAAAIGSLIGKNPEKVA